MQRPLKFRVFSASKNEMDYSPNTYCVDDINSAIDLYPSHDYSPLMQFTGLHDKNGKEIYEGDILSFDGNMTADNSLGFEPNGYIYNEDSIHEVIWDKDNCCWNLRFSDEENIKENWKYRRDTRLLMIEHSKNIEIIGNIFENPELVEGKE